jgi:hypothetical protein
MSDIRENPTSSSDVEMRDAPSPPPEQRKWIKLLCPRKREGEPLKTFLDLPKRQYTHLVNSAISNLAP